MASNVALRIAYDTRPVLVNVRWAPSVDAAVRQRLEQRYGLLRGVIREDRTWGYYLADLSRPNIEGIVRDPAVEDTHHLDRRQFLVSSDAERAPDSTSDPDIPVAYELLSLSALVGAIVMAAAWAESRVPISATWRSLYFPAGLAITVAVGYWPITLAMIRQGDFQHHISSAVALTLGRVAVPHILFHTLTAEGIMFGLTPTGAAVVVMLVFQVLAAYAVSWFARRAGASAGVAMCLGISAVFIAPIIPSQLADTDLIPAGYFLPNALHSPTVIVAKAFVPLLIELGVMLSGVATLSLSRSAIVAVVILAGLAKPHYVSCLLPVVIVSCAWSWWCGRRVAWDLLSAFIVAAVAVLLWISVGEGTMSGGTVIFAPLMALRAAYDNQLPVDALSIGARACSDLAFPIVTLILWPGARRFPALLVAWAAYAVGLGQALLLAESGPLLVDGNFFWSPQLATFGLMAASAAWLGRSSVHRDWRTSTAWTVLILHVACGVWWINARVAAG